ncbi:MAG: rRNA maturation RNase YbeY [Hyphomonadaceae bacterium]|jgi:probable rRNA maturation factor|nr:rRNA maturation RNase YbeY [Hyphomonadaceae bacterium]
MTGFALDLCVEDEAWDGHLDAIGPLAVAVAHEVAARIDVPDLEAAVLLTSDTAVAALNGQWRGKPGPTNVLSFPAPEGAGTLGDIALAHGVIAREAAAQGKTVLDHTAHLMVHGVLHLLGYDHEADDEAAEMEGLEVECLAALGIANPYEDP